MIKQLLNEHKAAQFPAGYRGEEIRGIDLVLLDADTVGCIDTYIGRNFRNGNLDNANTAILGLCYRDIAMVVRDLSGEAMEYFQRLETLARLTLEAIRDKKRTA